MMISSILFWLFFLLPFILVFTYFAILQKFFNVVEREDDELWEKIGRPHIVMNNNIGNGMSVLICLFKSSYKKSSNNVIKYGNLAKRYLVACFIVMVFYSYGFLSLFIESNK
jgi:hypothetical protein